MLWMLILCLVAANSQYFQTGIKRSTPYSQGDNNYTISSTLSSKDLEVIISIATFTSLPTKTSCFVYSQGYTTVNLTCTNNLQSFFFLFYQRTPMVYSNHYNHYFFEGNDHTSLKWLAPINQTYIATYQMRAFLTTVVQIDALNVFAAVKQTEDNLGFNISRSSNVRRIGFYFIIIQTSFPYSYNFQDFTINSDKKDNKLPNSARSIWGIQALLVGKDIPAQPAFLMRKSGLGRLDVSPDTLIEGFIFTFRPNHQHCKGYYLPSQQTCNQSCSLTVFTRTFNHLTLKYCVSDMAVSQDAYLNNNLHEAMDFTFAGCKDSAVSELSSVRCASCGEGFLIINQQCVCSIGTYFDVNACQLCNEQTCPSIAEYQITTASHNLTSTALSIRINLAQNVQYLFEGSPQFAINVTINNQLYQVNASYNTSNKCVSINLQSIPTSSKYVITLSDTSGNASSLFLVKHQNFNYLWGVSVANLVKMAPVSTQSIIRYIQPAFSHSEKTIPGLIGLALLVGHKINAFSFFQTASILYLITFINFDSHYQDISDIIRSLFTFQPSTLLNIVGTNSYFSYPSLDVSKIHYDSKIFAYTQGQYYLGMATNAIIMIISEIAVVYGVIKLLKKVFSPSSNEVRPDQKNQNARNRRSKFQNIRRSVTKADGEIKWLPEPQLNENTSIKEKIFLKLCIIDSKKATIFISILSVHLVSHSLLILYEFTLPFTDNFSIYSRLASSLCLFFILLLPGFLTNHQPLYILKATAIIYKRKVKKIGQVWLYFYSVYIESVALPLAVVFFSNGALQVLSLTFLSIAKLLILRKAIKRLDALKQFTVICLFITLILTFVLPLAYQTYIKQAFIVCILLILALEALKLLRSVMIILLSFFRSSTPQPKQAQKAAEKSEKPMLILPSHESEGNPIDIENIVIQTEDKIEPFVIPQRPRKRRFRFKHPPEDKQGDKGGEGGNHQGIN